MEEMARMGGIYTKQDKNVRKIRHIYIYIRLPATTGSRNYGWMLAGVRSEARG
jgi:hypothetical protein